MIRPLRVALLALLLASPGTASAFDVATSSKGAPLHWAPGAVSFTLALDPGPDAIDVAAARDVAVASAATWQAALASTGLDVSIAAAPASAAPHAADGVNTVRWVLDAADPDREAGLLGRTFVAYHPATGELQDADVVLDAADFTWTMTPGTCGNEYDLQSALTHELGHAIGLAHAIGHPEATMFATGDACETGKRDLATDDLAGVAELYAPPAAGGGCASAGSPGAAGGCLLVAAVVLGRRRRRALAVGAAAVALATPAAAAQLHHLELEDLAARAVMVVRGHVVATTVVRDPGLETDSRVVVDECLAGSCPRELQVRRHGGELADDGLWVDGEAALTAGDEVVLYLRVDRDQHARVLGGVQGLWRIERPASAAVVGVRDLRGHELATEDGARAGEREVVALDALRATVRAGRL